VYSAETGRTYEIVGPWLDNRGTAKYLYRGNDEGKGAFVADRAHQTLKKISGKQGVSEGTQDKFLQNFQQINQIVTKEHSDTIRTLLLQMFPKAKEIIELQYKDEDGTPFAEWRKIIYEIDNWILTGPAVVDMKSVPIDSEDYQVRLQKYQQYIADKQAGKPARYFRQNDSDPRTIDFSRLPPITLAQSSTGTEIVDGMHRATLAKIMNKPLKAYIWKNSPNQHPNVAEIKSLFSNFEKSVAANPASSAKTLSENFADGKNPGRKGLSRRVGIPQKATLGQLEKIAKSSTGERRRMAQWQLNMRRGRNKKK
jgi:hypothetical protein